MAGIESFIYCALLVVGVGLVGGVVYFRAYLTPLKKNLVRLSWDELGKVVFAGRRYRPAAIADEEGRVLLLLVRPRKEGLICTCDPATGALTAPIRVPPDLLPIGDMALDGDTLYLAAHGGRGLVRVDLHASCASGTAEITGSLSTGLRRIGGLCFVQFRGERLLALTENRGRRMTYLVDLPRAMDSGDLRAAVRARYHDTGHAQCLAWDGRRLYKVAANSGRDLLYRIDLERAVQTGSLTFGIEETYFAPGKQTGGIAVMGGKILIGGGFFRRLFLARLPESPPG